MDQDAAKQLAEDLRRWKDAHHGAGAGYRPEIGPLPPRTLSESPLEPLYTPADVDPEALRAEAIPGAPPFTRGLHPGMYRQRLWTFRQYAGFGSAAETNARFRKLLAAGQTGLSVAFDLPTQLGLDPDHARAAGEVGRVGVSLASVEEMLRLFEGIDFGAISTSMTINAPAAVLLAFYQVAAEERGVPAARLRGTVQNDILKEYAARNNFVFPPGPSMDLTVDVLEHCTQTLLNFYPISISGYHLREAGCTAPQEVAFTLANGLAYLQAARARGIDPERLGEQLSFFFASTSELLEEVAKFRAARRLWAKLLAERFGIANPKALQLRFHVQTAGSLLTSQQAENNLVRVAIQALAAVLGGCQSLHTNAFDEALGLPGEVSARLALATQQILALETGVANTADPLGGSYAVEALTGRLEADARALLDEVDRLGGAVEAVEQGFYQRRIAEAAYRYQKDVEDGTRRVVGVNCFTQSVDGAGAARSIQSLDPALESEARERVAALRRKRGPKAAEAALAELNEAARANVNRMPAILASARARCTVGEICGVLRQAYGEYRPRS
ncbi:MAG: methylmalonyl-CoA mutase family protein [Planctomycetota bacterium]|nr:methylmalonyl-CoA mutase family protein [Planctomycetota bacterium]